MRLRAVWIDPLSLQIGTNLSLVYYMAGQNDRAVDQARKPLELDPNFARGLFRLGKALLQKSHFEEAISAFQRALSVSDDAVYLSGLGHAYAVTGRKREAQEIVLRLEESSKKRYVSPYHIAMIYAGLGDKEQTFKWLDEACSARDAFLDRSE